MRYSALRYMITRGMLAGILITAAVTGLAIPFGSDSMRNAVQYGTGNDPALMLATALMMGVIPGALFGTFVGGLLGLINGLVIELIQQRYFRQITDASVYAWTLTLVCGVITVAGFAFYEFRHAGRIMQQALPFMAIASIAAAFLARRYAYLDMKQRRDKKALA